MIFENRFTGKVAIVTGGYQGIGGAISKRFVAEGGMLMVAGRSQEKLDAFIAEVNSENIAGCVCDVSNEESVKNLIAKTTEIYGKIDIVFNNAGVMKRGNFLDMPIEDLDACYMTNVRGCALVSQYAVKEMIKQGIPGVIVNTASTNAMIASPGQPAYGTTKAAVNLLTKCMALDLAEHNIRVNAFGPGGTTTEMTKSTLANLEKLAMFLNRLDIKRYADPEEQAGVALFLASDDASFMTGAFVPVDGGITSRV